MTEKTRKKLDPTKILQDSVEQIVKISQDVAEQGFKKTAELTQKQLEAITGDAEKKSQTYQKYLGDFQDLFKAYVLSYTALSRGIEEATKEVTDFSQDLFTKNLEMSKSIIGCKSAQELYELQAKWTKDTYNHLTNEAGKLSEITTGTANEVIEPIQKQVQQTFEKIFKVA